MFVFGIAFGTPPAPILQDYGVIRGLCFALFSHVLGDAAKLQISNTSYEKCLILGGAGASFLHYVCKLVEAFFGVAVKRTCSFCEFCRLSLPKDSYWAQCSQILQILHKKKRAKIEA